MFSFPKRSSSISTQLILHFWFPIFTFFHSSQQEVHAFSMTSNKGQSLVWMRRVLRDWGTFTITKHKIGSTGRNKKKQGLKLWKTDLLISRFCRHKGRTGKYSFSMRGEIVWTDTLTSRRGLRGRDSQRGWWGAVWLVCIQYVTVCGEADAVVSRSFFLSVEFLSKFALKHWLLCFSWGSAWERTTLLLHV